MKTIDVKLPQTSYKVSIDDWNLDEAALTIHNFLKEDRLYILTNKTIKKLYQRKLSQCFSKSFKLIWITIPEGERFKTLRTCEKIHEELVNKKANRSSFILALGGGVIGDIAGFVAATYMRGINYIQMPTTLLAQVDSSVGGKTGVDLKIGKNLVGAFYQPKAVIVLTRFLKTLPEKEMINGLAEVIKYALIADNHLFYYLDSHYENIFKHDTQTLEKITHLCLSLKAKIVAKDEKENNQRALLNFGHSVGHAIELLKHYKNIKHGEAIAMGMIYASELSASLGFLDKADVLAIKLLITKMGLPTVWPSFTETAYKKALLKDKKAQDENIQFICLTKIGKAHIEELSINNILQCLKR
jgi:3-dehydroquinate synthase